MGFAALYPNSALAMGEMAQNLLLSGQHILQARALETSYRFQFRPRPGRYRILSVEFCWREKQVLVEMLVFLKFIPCVGVRRDDLVTCGGRKIAGQSDDGRTQDNFRNRMANSTFRLSL